jgi:TetR/AcrR family transcriptional regulator
MDNKDNILACALRLFSAQGYDAVGVQDICDAAGIKKPTLYHYYHSKNGLLSALLEQYATALVEQVRTAAQYRHDLPLTLREVMRAFFAFAGQNPAFYRIMLALWFAPLDSEPYHLVIKYDLQLQEILDALFQQATNDHGNMRNRQHMYAASFLGQINTCIGLALNQYASLDEPMVERATHQFEHGIYS